MIKRNAALFGCASLMAAAAVLMAITLQSCDETVDWNLANPQLSKEMANSAKNPELPKEISDQAKRPGFKNK